MTDSVPPHKLFGRYHDVVLLVLGFTLTTIVGGLLAQRWQSHGAAIARDAEHRRSEQLASSRVFDELSRLMDKRLYRMRRLHDGLAGNASDLSDRWNAYREVLFEWNENLNRNLALTQRYFGDSARFVLETRINEGFRELGALLEGRGYPPQTDRAGYRQQKADALNNVIYDFDVRLITDVQRGAVGEYRSDR